MDPWAAVTDFLKQSPKTWTGLFVASAALLGLGGPGFSEGLLSFISPYCWVMLIVTASFLIAHWLFWARERVLAAKEQTKKVRSLQQLGDEERRLLRNYIEPRQTCVMLLSTDVRALSLQARGILYVEGRHIGATRAIPFLIREWVFEHLVEHPELLADEPKRAARPKKR